MQDVDDLFPGVRACGKELGEQIPRVDQRGLDRAQEPVALIVDQIVEAVDHHALPMRLKPVRAKGEVAHRHGGEDRAVQRLSFREQHEQREE